MGLTLFFLTCYLVLCLIALWQITNRYKSIMYMLYVQESLVHNLHLYTHSLFLNWLCGSQLTKSSRSHNLDISVFKHPSYHLLLLNTLICSSSQFCGGLVWTVKEKLTSCYPHPPNPQVFFLFTWNVFCSCCFKSSLDLSVTKQQMSIKLMTVISEGKIRLQWIECTVLVLWIVDCVALCMCVCC